MYKISDNQYALEEGDCISFVRDGGGALHLEALDECAAIPLVYESGVNLVIIEAEKESNS